MNCLSCGRKIPADRVKPAGIHGYPDALCAPCIECVWSGSIDALTVVNALLYRIEQLNQEIECGLQSVPGLFARSNVTQEQPGMKPGVLQNFDDELLGTHFKENCCGSDDC